MTSPLARRWPLKKYLVILKRKGRERSWPFVLGLFWGVLSSLSKMKKEERRLYVPKESQDD